MKAGWEVVIIFIYNLINNLDILKHTRLVNPVVFILVQLFFEITSFKLNIFSPTLNEFFYFILKNIVRIKCMAFKTNFKMFFKFRKKKTKIIWCCICTVRRVWNHLKFQWFYHFHYGTDALRSCIITMEKKLVVVWSDMHIFRWYCTELVLQKIPKMIFISYLILRFARTKWSTFLFTSSVTITDFLHRSNFTIFNPKYQTINIFITTESSL